MRKKRIVIAVLVLFLTKLFAQYHILEVFDAYMTKVTLCTNNKTYVLIANGYDIYPEYLVIFDDKNFTARQCYGEIILCYYHVKHMKKKIESYNGEFYQVPLDNSEEEIAFLRALTDSFNLAEYKSFKFIDNNESKKEEVDFFDIEGEKKEDEIGGNAGFLMQINADDFMEYLGGLK